jgi:crotonobetainyl-CoA:carnitine CoA-transferase CaiB-like acyl-CoA transferase
VSDDLPLSGTTVLDLSLQLPGPYATLLLSSLGARVLKVEPPGGDPARDIDPPMFERLNAGKELLVLDLKREAGREVLRRLVTRSDVLVEGFRPGVAERLGAGPEALEDVNPRLVYCSLSGFGRGGPLARRAGHDLNFLGMAGAAGGGEGGADIRVPLVDLAAGTNAALAIVAGLMAARASGRGRHLDLALLDAAVAWSLVKRPRPGAEGAYGVFVTADERRVAVSVMEGPMWRRLCAALAWSDWLDDPRLATHDGRRARAAEIERRLREELLRQDAAAVLALADEHDLAITGVNDVGDVARDEQVLARGLLDGDRWLPLGPAGRALPVEGIRAAGADTLPVVGELGVSDGERERLRAQGAFGSAVQ